LTLAVTIAIILAALTFIIAFKIITYSFYAQTLIWGIIIVLIILFFMAFLLGTAILVLNRLTNGLFHSIMLNDLEFCDVKIPDKTHTKTRNTRVIVTKRSLVSAVIISIFILIYSFFAMTLLWGITAVVMIMILTPVLSGFVALIKFLLVDENKTS
jgi:uncharacterized membrane protein YdfJ with MMPL/SSD domain